MIVTVYHPVTAPTRLWDDAALTKPVEVRVFNCPAPIALLSSVARRSSGTWHATSLSTVPARVTFLVFFSFSTFYCCCFGLRMVYKFCLFHFFYKYSMLVTGCSRGTVRTFYFWYSVKSADGEV